MSWTVSVVGAGFAAWLSLTVIVWTVQMIQAAIKAMRDDD